MKLKRSVPNLEDVDEKFHDLYEEQDDKTFLLTAVDTTDMTAKVNEFRQNNISLNSQVTDLSAQVDSLKSKFDGIDPAEYHKVTEAMSKIDQQEDRDLLAAGKFEEVVSRRTSAVRAEFDLQLEAKDVASNTLHTQIHDLKTQIGLREIDDEIMRSLERQKIRARTGAREDIIQRARTTFQITDEGKAVAKDQAGAMYGTDGNPLTMDEYSQRLMEAAPHLFEQGAGGGAGGEGGGGAGNRQFRDRKKTRLENPTPFEFGKNLEDIATGKVEVEND